MFLNLIKGDISINTTIFKKIDFGDPIDKIHVRRYKAYRFRAMTPI